MEKENKEGIAGVNYQQLLSMITEAKAEEAAAKGKIAKLQEELEARLAPSARRMLADADKTFGTVNMPLQGGLNAKVEVPKKVEWDSDKLFDMAISMPMERARQIFKFAVSVPEKIYEGVKAVDLELGGKLDAARTLKPGPVKITLTQEAA